MSAGAMGGRPRAWEWAVPVVVVAIGLVWSMASDGGWGRFWVACIVAGAVLVPLVVRATRPPS